MIRKGQQNMTTLVLAVIVLMAVLAVALLMLYENRDKLDMDLDEKLAISKLCDTIQMSGCSSSSVSRIDTYNIPDYGPAKDLCIKKFGDQKYAERCVALCCGLQLCESPNTCKTETACSAENHLLNYDCIGSDAGKVCCKS